MDGSHQFNQGFTPHVMHQINDMAASANVSSGGNNSNRRGGRQYQGWIHSQNQPPYRFLSDQQQAVATMNSQTHHTPPGWRHAPANHILDPNSFPPLGSSKPIDQSEHSPAPYTSNQIHSQSQPLPTYHQAENESVSGKQHRGQGNLFRGGRGRGRGYLNNHQNHRAQQYHISPNEFTRPQQVQHNRLHAPDGNPYFGTAEQQRAFRHRIMMQSDFLSSIATHALETQITQEEYQAKESFRQTIQRLAREAILHNSPSILAFDIESVRLKVYGSLGSGFGVAGSDMDLLLTFPENKGSANNIESDSRRWLEKALLEAGHGARLLTNTRVPILKVCERPSPELLKNLRHYRQQWEDATVKNPDEPNNSNRSAPLPSATLPSTDIIDGMQKILLEAIEIPLPDLVPNEQVKLEFAGDCGIQCDVNFTNYVALYNTELLKTYGHCDPRVRQVGLFVKHWAKSRDINTPYKGTLSSYGYIMMVLHYLMNIANPPIIPNLQVVAKDQHKWEDQTAIEMVEGFDVRFVHNPDQIRHIMATMAPNHESIGSLLRGFFWYYACNGGFHWTRDVISIRTRGGQLSKHAKGWTGAKWSESKQHVRLRYLLAIEDPFEVEHNIGRTVGHSGIVAIRDEFRRAWSIIDNVRFDEVQRLWYWSDNGEIRAADILTQIAENRGDLLRKDQDAHKEKMRTMRREAEAQEQALHDARSEKSEETGTGHS